MGDIKQTRSLVDKAQREERKASNEMYNCEQQALDQQTQLDTCLNYRDECLNGLKTAKQSGLSVVQVRECQLLVQYLDSVVETRQYKADISQENHEKSKQVWQKKKDHFKSLKKELIKMEELNLQKKELEINDGKIVDSKTYRTYLSNK